MAVGNGWKLGWMRWYKWNQLCLHHCTPEMQTQVSLSQGHGSRAQQSYQTDTPRQQPSALYVCWKKGGGHSTLNHHHPAGAGMVGGGWGGGKWWRERRCREKMRVRKRFEMKAAGKKRSGSDIHKMWMQAFYPMGDSWLSKCVSAKTTHVWMAHEMPLTRFVPRRVQHHIRCMIVFLYR